MRPPVSRAILSTLLVCAACSDALSPDPSHVGLYTLHTVNGAALPFIIAQLGDERVEVSAGHIILNVDGTFTDHTTFRIVEAAGTRREETVRSGTYTTNGSVVQLSPEGSERYTVALSDNRTLTQAVESYLLVYRK